VERVGRVLLLLTLVGVGAGSVRLLLDRAETLGAAEATQQVKNHRFGAWPMSSPSAWQHGTGREGAWRASPADRLGGRWTVELALVGEETPYRFEVRPEPPHVAALDDRTRRLVERIRRWAEANAPGGVLPSSAPDTAPRE
jgi:hypothetical protein